MASEPKIEDLAISDKRVGGDGAPSDDEDDVVNPWDVAAKSTTGVDYDKLISESDTLVQTLVIMHDSLSWIRKGLKTIM